MKSSPLHGISIGYHCSQERGIPIGIWAYKEAKILCSWTRRCELYSHFPHHIFFFSLASSLMLYIYVNSSGWISTNMVLMERGEVVNVKPCVQRPE